MTYMETLFSGIVDASPKGFRNNVGQPFLPLEPRDGVRGCYVTVSGDMAYLYGPNTNCNAPHDLRASQACITMQRVTDWMELLRFIVDHNDY